MPSVIDSLFIEVGLDTAKFEEGQKKLLAEIKKLRDDLQKSGKDIEDSGDKTGRAIRNVAREAFALFGVFLTAQAVKNFISDINSADLAIGRLVTTIGLGPARLGALQGFARETGISFESITNSVANIHKMWSDIAVGKIPGHEAFLAFQKAGVAPPLGKSPEEQFKATIQAIINLSRIYKDQPGMAWTYGKELGVSPEFFAEVARNADQIKDILKDLEKYAPKSGDIKASQDLQKAWGELQNSAVALGRAIKTAIAPALSEIITKMAEWLEKNKEWIAQDLSKVFVSLLDVLKRFAEWIITDAASKQIENFFTSLATAATATANAITAVVKALEKLGSFPTFGFGTIPDTPKEPPGGWSELWKQFEKQNYVGEGGEGGLMPAAYYGSSPDLTRPISDGIGSAGGGGQELGSGGGGRGGGGDYGGGGAGADYSGTGGTGARGGTGGVEEPMASRGGKGGGGGRTYAAGSDTKRIADAIERQEGYNRKGTIPNKYNNPGDIMYGPWARAHGAIGKVPGHQEAIFPDYKTGREALETFIQRFHGKSISQMNKTYAEDPHWGRGVSRYSGIPPGRPLNLRGAAKDVDVAGGSGGGGGGYPESGSDKRIANSLPPNVIARGYDLVRRGRSSGELQHFMREQGYPLSGNWCGEFAASVVKSAGMKPPPGAAVASNWLKWGVPVSSKNVRSGDIGVRANVAPGQLGGHVGIVSSVDQRGGEFKLLGGNQGTALARHRLRSNYVFRRGLVEDTKIASAGGGESVASAKWREKHRLPHRAAQEHATGYGAGLAAGQIQPVGNYSTSSTDIHAHGPFNVHTVKGDSPDLTAHLRENLKHSTYTHSNNQGPQ